MALSLMGSRQITQGSSSFLCCVVDDLCADMRDAFVVSVASVAEVRSLTVSGVFQIVQGSCSHANVMFQIAKAMRFTNHATICIVLDDVTGRRS